MTKKQRMKELERRVTHIEACIMNPKRSPYPNHYDAPFSLHPMWQDPSTMLPRHKRV